MARIIRDPTLEDNIVEAALNEPDAESRVRALYEDGCLVLLRDFRFDLDYAFLNELDFDVDGPPDIMRKLKKYSVDHILNLSARSNGPVEQYAFKHVFRGDAGRLKHFQDQVRSGDNQVYALYKRIFPNYRDTKQIYTWRFTETLFENLHWDNFGTTEDFHQVRIFCNVDGRPRLWRTSERSETFARRVYAEKSLQRFADETPDRFAFALNNKVLGGMAGACLDGMRVNHLAFEQGDVWLCETRLVSHQIYSGYRAIASMFFIDPESMDNPELRYDARVKRIHADFARVGASVN